MIFCWWLGKWYVQFHGIDENRFFNHLIIWKSTYKFLLRTGIKKTFCFKCVPKSFRKFLVFLYICIYIYINWPILHWEWDLYQRSHLVSHFFLSRVSFIASSSLFLAWRFESVQYFLGLVRFKSIFFCKILYI